MEFLTPPFLPMIFSIAIYMVVGYFWYSHYLFGNAWKEDMGISIDEKPAGTAFLGALVNSAVISYFLYLFIAATGSEIMVEGARVGLYASIGFVLTNEFSAVLWAKKPLRAFLIDASCMIIAITLSGAVLTL